MFLLTGSTSLLPGTYVLALLNFEGQQCTVSMETNPCMHVAQLMTLTVHTHTHMGRTHTHGPLAHTCGPHAHTRGPHTHTWAACTHMWAARKHTCATCTQTHVGRTYANTCGPYTNTRGSHTRTRGPHVHTHTHMGHTYTHTHTHIVYTSLVLQLAAGPNSTKLLGRWSRRCIFTLCSNSGTAVATHATNSEYNRLNYTVIFNVKLLHACMQIYIAIYVYIQP